MPVSDQLRDCLRNRSGGSHYAVNGSCFGSGWNLQTDSSTCLPAGGWVLELCAPNVFFIDGISGGIQDPIQQMAEIYDAAVLDLAEISGEEYQSSKILCSYLKQEGFQIEKQ